MNISTNRIIFSVEQANKSREENQFNNAEARRTLENFGMTFIEIQGVYKGTSEVSFMVFHSNKYVEQTVKQIVKTYNQESILNIDSNNQAYLEFFNGEKNMELGRWNEVSKDYAEKQKAYSVIQGRYFLTE